MQIIQNIIYLHSDNKFMTKQIYFIYNGRASYASSEHVDVLDDT